jgi:glycerate 2-kinase
MTSSIAIASGAFKGSLSAMDACCCMEKAFRKFFRRTKIRRIPMADGGDGTMEAVVDAMRGRIVYCRVHDPLGRSIKSRLGFIPAEKLAIIEMAEASGLVILKPSERNPLKTSTAGTGDLIRKALDLGARRILIGIGGSATNDGGMGMARSLGARLLDVRGNDLLEGGGALGSLDRIDLRGLDPRLRTVKIEVACDVRNPLLGPRGAAAVYSPQKGATPAMVRRLENGMRRLASAIRKDLCIDVAHMLGAGAAGGTGAGLVAFLGARLRPGSEIVADAVHLERRLKGCEIVITGEGRIDGQTAFGKTPVGVARVAKKLGIPVFAICGSAGKGAEKVLSCGINEYFAASDRPMTEVEIRRKGRRMVSACAERVARLLFFNTEIRRLPNQPILRKN